MSNERPYPGWMPVEQLFPWWDWEQKPEGPPLDDPRVKARTEIQWKQFLKDAKRRRE